MFATSPHAALSHGDFIIPDTWPYQTVAQSKTLCHGCESEVQKGSPGERSLTSGLHTDSFRLSFSKLQPRKAPNCLLLNWKKKKKKKFLLLWNWEHVQCWRSTHMSHVYLVPVCVNSYYIFSGILRSSLTFIHFFSPLSWHQLVPFFLFIPSHPLSLCWDLPASLTLSCLNNHSLFPFNQFLLSLSQLICQNCLIKSHPSFPLAFPHPSDQGTVKCLRPSLCSWISQLPWLLTLLCQQSWSCSPWWSFLT